MAGALSHFLRNRETKTLVFSCTFWLCPSVCTSSWGCSLEVLSVKSGALMTWCPFARVRRCDAAVFVQFRVLTRGRCVGVNKCHPVPFISVVTLNPRISWKFFVQYVGAQVSLEKLDRDLHCHQNVWFCVMFVRRERWKEEDEGRGRFQPMTRNVKSTFVWEQGKTGSQLGSWHESLFFGRGRIAAKWSSLLESTVLWPFDLRHHPDSLGSEPTAERTADPEKNPSGFTVKDFESHASNTDTICCKCRGEQWSSLFSTLPPH